MGDHPNPACHQLREANIVVGKFGSPTMRRTSNLRLGSYATPGLAQPSAR
jgi:hypothetical protein